MWGLIPCYAHNFLIRLAIGVRTSIEHMITLQILLKNVGGYSKSFHSVPALIDTKSTGDEDSLVRQPHIYILVHFLKDSPVVQQGDDQHQNLVKLVVIMFSLGC